MVSQLPHLCGISESSSSTVALKAPTITQKKLIPSCRGVVVRLKCSHIDSPHLEDLNQQQNNISYHATTTRRAAMTLASSAVLLLSNAKPLLAAEEKNEPWWVDGPIPIPPVYNKIANEQTGTRSFLKTPVYIADIGTKGRMYRLRKYAFDLLAMGDLIGQDVWPYIRRYLRLKSTFMYYDFDKVISAVEEDNKQPLTDLANRLFDSFETLLDAVKLHDLPKTKSSYQDTTVILQEVMDRMA